MDHQPLDHQLLDNSNGPSTAGPSTAGPSTTKQHYVPCKGSEDIERMRNIPVKHCADALWTVLSEE